MTQNVARYKQIAKTAAAALPTTTAVPDERIKRELSIALKNIIADATFFPALEKANFGVTNVDRLEERLAYVIDEIIAQTSHSSGLTA